MRNFVQQWQLWYRGRGEMRQISKELPEAIDLLTLVMQAGLDFQVALAHYLERAPNGPLRRVLAGVQAEMRTGTSRIEALRHLTARVPNADLTETARAMIQGIELGSSLTPILRAQAAALRKHRAFDAEKRAAIAPVKLMFPLFVFIFPTLFVILLGPVALTMSKGGGL